MRLVYRNIVLSTYHFRHIHIPGVVMFRRLPYEDDDDDDDALLLYDDYGEDENEERLLDVYEEIQGGHLQLDQFQTDGASDMEPVYYTTATASSSGSDVATQHGGGRVQGEHGLHRAPIDNDVELLDLHVLPDNQEEEKHKSCCDKLTQGYSWFLAVCPYVPILLTFVLLVTVTWTSYHYYPPPDFSEDPSKGFETRGTYISKAQSTLRRVRRAVMSHRQLTYRPPTHLIARQLGINEQLLAAYLGAGRDAGSWHSLGRKRRDIEEVKTGSHVVKSPSREKREDFIGGSNCECNFPQCLIHYPIFVFEPVNKAKDLFTVAAMHSICSLQDQVIYPNDKRIGRTFCQAKSIANTVASLSRKHCQDITQVDLDYTRDLIRTCGRYTYNNISSGEWKHIPSQCSTYNRDHVTDILINLAQVGFYDLATESVGKLSYSAVYMMGMYFDEIEVYRARFEGRTVGDEQVRVTAVKFSNHQDLKWTLLGNYLISDLMYFGVALGLVFFIMFVYLRSVVLMLTTLLNVLVSFMTAYFLYYFVIRMTFFPYLNLLAGLVLIAVGADDMFIFYDCWEQAKAEDPTAPIKKIMEKTLRHAALSVFVTSLTTSSAFFANALSSITAIQNFAIFAGISILANLFYMLTLTPAVIVCIEWFYRLYMKSDTFRQLDAQAEKVTQKLHELSVAIFHRVFPVIIDKTWFLWAFLLLMQGIGACVVVFVYPKFELPNSKDFQLFPASNIIENWDLQMETKFQSVMLSEEGSHERVKFYVLFGIHADDPGSHFDPDDKDDTRPVTLDPTFDLGDAETQVFIYNLCHDLLKQPFMPDHIPVTCQLDAILEMLKANCNNPLVKSTGCCPTNIAIPIEGNMFHRCAAAYQVLLLQMQTSNSTHFLGNILGDFVFKGNSTEMAAYGIFVLSKYVPSFANEEMATYNEAVMGFVNKHLDDGPKGTKSGFVAYTDWFWLYDLQQALATGTFYSIGLSLSVAFVVMLMTSLNLLITIYAMITICFAITCTVAVLVFLGWQLNIIESLIISLAVGLSIDFTIHFGIAYRLSSAETSRKRTEEGFRTVGAAVAMAALTTFLAGVAVMPCQVLIYIKLGIFLMLVMTFSWLYSNFFFQSVCHIIGPSKQCYATCSTQCCCGGGCKNKTTNQAVLI